MNKNTLKKIARQMNNVLKTILVDLEEPVGADDFAIATVKDGKVFLNAEHHNGQFVIDYWGEFRGGHMYIDPAIEEIAADHDGYLEWVNPAQAVLVY